MLVDVILFIVSSKSAMMICGIPTANTIRAMRAYVTFVACVICLLTPSIRCSTEKILYTIVFVTLLYSKWSMPPPAFQYLSQTQTVFSHLRLFHLQVCHNYFQ